MQLLNPIWLLALTAVCIPVVIHLWNIRPGKTLKVGSISLFSESSPKSSRSFKLLDILLLLLRCLLLSLLAFLLTMPVWQRHLTTGKTKGWVLIPKKVLQKYTIILKLASILSIKAIMSFIISIRVFQKPTWQH